VSEHAVLRYRYVSYNPGEVDPANNTDAIFYNCVDIKIARNPHKRQLQKSLQKSVVSSPSKLLAPAPCRPPAEWTAEGREHFVDGSVTTHQIYWNRNTNLTRWDKVSTKDGSLQLYNNYSSGAEYLYDPIADSCLLYGSDPIYDWVFGAPFMTYKGRTVGKLFFSEIGRLFSF
jgi:hypothetical protein